MCFNNSRMKKTTKTLVYLDNNELNQLKDDKTAFVDVQKCEHHLSLHPFHLSDVNNAVKELLNAGITKYNRSLGGIILGYQNVKILGSQAPINFDSCFVHIDVEVEFFVFKPAIGQILNGVVNKKMDNHIGCLVHKIFNVSLPKPAEAEEWLGTKTEIRQEIQFRITFVDLDGRLPYIKGELVSILSEDSGISTSEETHFSSSNKPRRIIFEDDDDEVPSTSKEIECDTAEDHSPHKKKKHKKNRDDVVQQETETIPKKKKKHKKQQETEGNVELKESYKAHSSESIVTNEDKKKTKKKKSKDNKVDDYTKGNNEEVVKKKSKKSKKGKELRDDFDTSLPDLNLDGLFNEDSLSTQKKNNADVPMCNDEDRGKKPRRNSTTHDIEWSGKVIELPADSDLEYILQNTSPKRKSKKRKHSSNDVNVSTKKAKKVKM